VSISTVAPVANSGAAALTDVGIGSGLNVDAIVSQLMTVESQPLTQLQGQITSYNATLSAYGIVTSALSTFQTAVQALNAPTAFNADSVTAGNSSILSGTATTSAVNGNYNVDVTQLAQAQSLTAAGQASTSTAIGDGTISFQFGTISAPSTVVGTALDSSVATSGIAAGSLTINGTTIPTDATTTSAAALASQINAAGITGVTATADASSGALSFSQVSVGAGDSYNLTVGGVTVENITGASPPTTLTAAQLDSTLSSTGAGSVGAQLAAAGISFTGSAAAGTLQFTTSNGSALTASQTLTNTSGNSSGGLTGGGLDNAGTTQTYNVNNIALASSSPITIGGSDPSLAGFTAGTTAPVLTNGTYSGAAFTQDSSIAGGSVVINSSNNSLQGIASAINAANVGVTASVINDGSGTPYRLTLTSTATGATSSMKISVSDDPNGDDDSALSSLLSYNPTGTQNLTQSVAAQNTNLTVNGIPITSASTNISGAIQGVTLNVSSTGTTSVAVAQNTSSEATAVSSFVSAYNALNTTLGQATAYNASTQVAGPLLGDQGVDTVEAQLRQVLGSPIAGISQNLNSLAQLGITFQSDGSMALNNSTLQSALSSNANGVAALFSSVGTASDSLVSYNTATSATQPGSYAVNISQLATQGTLTGSAAPGLTITKGSNDNLSVDIDGINATVTLAAGTYTATSLAATLQTAINGNSAVTNAGSSVNVSVNSSGALSITSNRYGSASLVTLTGDAATSLVGSTPTGVNGLDVEGTIGGNPAVGSGQVLTASAGAPTAGLALTVDGGTVGARGTVAYSQGYATQLNNLLTSFAGTSGPITTEATSLNNSVTNVDKQITALNATLAAQQANYMSEFEALDTTISSLDATQTFLTQQLASLAANDS